MRSCLKSGDSTTSSRPPCPLAHTSGTPVKGADSLPSGLTNRRCPGNSVTRKPCWSGKNASAHGWSRPLATGVAVIVLAFAAHIVVNGVFDTGFTHGETVLGIGSYGLLGLVFIAGTLFGDLSMADLYSGLTLFGVLAAGFLTYLATRHGLRGAFSRFHIKPAGMGVGVSGGRR